MKELVAALARGEVVAIATESFFGLLADATSSRALDTLLRVKPRGAEKGIPLILPDEPSWSLLVPELPRPARVLAEGLWPGALSIAVPARSELDPRVTLDGSVAVRLPGPCPAGELARAFGRPVTATSANPPGETPATTDEEVRRALAGALAAGSLHVVPGTSPGGLPSTLVTVRGEVSRIVREGRVPRARVREVLERAGLDLDGPGLPG